MDALAQDTGQSTAGLFGSDRMWGLKELPLPDPVSYWPQTAGWYVLLLLLLLLVALLAWLHWRRWQRDAYRRDALSRLQAIADTLNNPAGQIANLTELPLILRHAALRAGRRQDVASLRGRDWIAWLNASSGKTLFDDEAAALIDQLPYATPTSLAVLRDEPRTQKLLDASQTWVRDHRAAV